MKSSASELGLSSAEVNDGITNMKTIAPLLETRKAKMTKARCRGGTTTAPC